MIEATKTYDRTPLSPGDTTRHENGVCVDMLLLPSPFEEDIVFADHPRYAQEEQWHEVHALLPEDFHVLFPREARRARECEADQGGKSQRELGCDIDEAGEDQRRQRTAAEQLCSPAGQEEHAARDSCSDTEQVEYRAHHSHGFCQAGDFCTDSFLGIPIAATSSQSRLSPAVHGSTTMAIEQFHKPGNRQWGSGQKHENRCCESSNLISPIARR